MIASQETAAGANAVEAESLVSTAAVIRRKSARQALSDRASRGLSLMSGFKSRQEKSDGSSKPGGHDRSPAGGRGNQGVIAAAATAAAAVAATGASDAPQAAATAPEGARGGGGAGAAGRSGSEEDFGPPGGGGHLTKLVLKFTTASESDVQPSCEITTAGATIGQSDENTVSIPSDSMLAPLNHAIVKYEQAAPAPALLTAAGAVAAVRGAADEEPSRSKEGSSTPTPGAKADGGGGGARGAGRSAGCETAARGDGLGGFFFSDGGQETDFAAAFRIRVGEGNREWPLSQDCHFSAGLTVFRVHRTRPTGSSPQERDTEGDPDSAVVEDTTEDESRPGEGSGAGGRGAEARVHASEDEEAKGDASGDRVGSDVDAAADAAHGDGGGDDDGDDAAGGSAGAHTWAVTPTATAGTAATGAAAAAAASASASNTADTAKAPTESTRRKTTREHHPCLWLEAVAGCLKGQTWRVETAGATLGRASDNKLSLADKEMSRRHSKIEYDETLKDFFLCDLGSLNGTYMQMVGPYLPRRRLGLGDHLLVGRTGFSVNRFDYGISERMGARPTMEDRSIVIQDLGLAGLAGTALWPQTFAAVYDGHGGGQASEYLWGNLHAKVTSSLASRSKRLLAAAAAAAAETSPGRSPGSSKLAHSLFSRASGLSLGRKAFRGGGGGGGASGSGSGSDGGGVGGPWEALDIVVKEAIAEAFAAADKEFIATSRLPEAGSTATTCLVLGSRLYMANVGDSRTVVCREGKLRMASADHKPCRPDEQERVQRAGGFVAHRRVMGELAVSRAFGDSEFKGGGPAAGNSGRGGGGAPVIREDGGLQNGHADAAMEERETAYAQLITAEPEFLVSEITPQDEFLVLACDGVFDVLTSEEVVANVYEKMKIHADAQRCCEDLTEMAIVEKRTRDNVSLVLVVFNKWF